MKVVQTRECAPVAAAWCCQELDSALLNKKNVILGVAGGRTITGVLNKLSKYSLAWERIHIFLIDERCVPDEHKDSNAGVVRRNLIEPIYHHFPRIVVNFYTFQFNNSGTNVLEQIQRYTDKFQKMGGCFDIVLASAGEDGHIASLFPYFEHERDNSLYIEVNSAPKKPEHRVSVSMGVLQNSRAMLVLFCGQSKHKALQMCLDDGEYSQCPARVVKNIKRSIIVTDYKGTI